MLLHEERQVGELLFKLLAFLSRVYRGIFLFFVQRDGVSFLRLR